MKNNSRVVIAAPKSGSGKTLITIGLIKALLLRSKKVSAFKCGPDYIDPMFHKNVLGIPSKNLDLFFTDEEKTRELFLRKNESDISVIEGVMGLYDGLAGVSSEASTYHLATTLKAPIILVIDAKGMGGRSILAEIKGFLSEDKEKLIAGIILNRMSKSYFETLKLMLEAETGIPMIGCFPVNKSLDLESRHLGLVLPNEISELEEKIILCAKTLEENVDVQKIVEIAEAAKVVPKIPDDEETEKIIVQAPHKRIAVAKDEAFCFIYDDNINTLERLGAEIVYFSPIHDDKLPSDIDGLILYGGYPELYAMDLSLNTSMLESIKNAIDKGLPYLAECGGFMYLHDCIVTKDDEEFKMVGAIKGKTYYTGKLVRFGYMELTENTPCFLPEGTTIRGHEFHYYDSTSNGEDCTASKPVTGRSWKSTHVTKHCFAGFAHLYYESNVEFVKHFLNVGKSFDFI